MSPEDMRQRNFTKRARERLQRMDQAAQDLQSAFSLFPETKYEIVSLLSPVEATDEASFLAENDTESALGDKQALLQLSQAEVEQVRFQLMKPEQDEGRVWPVEEPGALKKPRALHKRLWLRSFAAVLCVAFLVGSFALVLQIVHHPTSGAAGTPELYVTTDNSVSRLASQNGRLTPLWSYTLSAPWTEQRIVEYGQQTHLSASTWKMLIDSPVTVSGNVAYFGGNADDPTTHQLHHYLYALNATNGALLWRYQIDGVHNGIPSPFFLVTDKTQMYTLEPGTVTGAPQVVQDTVYILVAVKPYMPQPHSPEYDQYYYIFALDRHTGTVRWSTRYFADLTQIRVAPDGSTVYATDANLLMAFNGENGQKQWQKEIPRPNGDTGFFDLQFANDTVYATMSTYAPIHSSQIYAFDPASGSVRWTSRPVNGLISPLAVDQGAVYFGSEAGHIYALRLNDGSQLWNYDASPGEAFVFLQKREGVIYARVTRSTYGTAASVQGKPPMLHIVALDASHGSVNWDTSIPQTQENFGTAQGWDSGQLAVGNDVLYTSMQNGLACSLNVSDGSFITCDTLTHDQMAPSLTLIGDTSG